MNPRPPHIVQVGANGFPFGMAAIEKIRLIGIGLIHAGAKVTVLSQKGVFDRSEPKDFGPTGSHEGIDYIFASGDIYRPESFLRRNWMKVVGFFREIAILRRFKKEGNLDGIIVHSMGFFPMLIYFLVSRWLKFKMVYILVEMNASMSSRQTWYQQISDFLLENIGLKLPDGHLPISQLLIDYLEEKAPDVPFLSIPILCEFEKFNLPKSEKQELNFLYCGSVSYIEVILFILEAFEGLETDETVYLDLILGGDPPGKQKVAEHIAGMKKKDLVRTVSNIPYSQLVQMYIDATALLIPMRHTMQDAARFPHKIGEYLAAGNPVLTTAVGEIPRYFTDLETALVAERYEIPYLTEQMDYILKHPEHAVEIGLAGQKLGREHFDCLMYGDKLLNFIYMLMGHKPKLVNQKEAYVRN